MGARLVIWVTSVSCQLKWAELALKCVALRNVKHASLPHVFCITFCCCNKLTVHWNICFDYLTINADLDGYWEFIDTYSFSYHSF